MLILAPAVMQMLYHGGIGRCMKANTLRSDHAAALIALWQFCKTIPGQRGTRETARRRGARGEISVDSLGKAIAPFASLLASNSDPRYLLDGSLEMYSSRIPGKRGISALGEEQLILFAEILRKSVEEEKAALRLSFERMICISASEC